MTSASPHAILQEDADHNGENFVDQTTILLVNCNVQVALLLPGLGFEVEPGDDEDQHLVTSYEQHDAFEHWASAAMRRLAELGIPPARSNGRGGAMSDTHHDSHAELVPMALILIVLFLCALAVA